RQTAPESRRRRSTARDWAQSPASDRTRRRKSAKALCLCPEFRIPARSRRRKCGRSRRSTVDRRSRKCRGLSLGDPAGAERAWYSGREARGATTFPRKRSHASYKGASTLTTTTYSVNHESAALERYSKRRFCLPCDRIYAL